MMPRAPRILVLADVGQPVYHVGDEAMGIAAVHRLRERGLEVHALTRDPEHTRRHIAGVAGCVRTLEFPWPPAERELRLMRVEYLLARLPEGAPGGPDGGSPEERAAWERDVDRLAEAPQDPEILRFIREVATMDGVVIAGGGNMNSRYGWLLHERCALGLVAQRLGLPLVVSGQTFGPALTEADAEVLTRLLASARLVGARESHSTAWARERGIPAVHGYDDAVALVEDGRSKATGSRPGHAQPADAPGPADAIDPVAAEPDSSGSRVPGPGTPSDGAPEGGTADHWTLTTGDRTLPELPERFLAVTLAPVSEEQSRTLARELDALCTVLGLAGVFLPHMGDPERQDGDVATHAGVAARMSAPTVLLPVLHAQRAAEIQGLAALAVTSRYHPAVFAVHAGQPVLGLVPDAFTDVRLRGVLEHAGLGDLAVPLGLLDGGRLTEIARSLGWDRSLPKPGTAAGGLPARTPAWSASWWDAVAARLRGEETPLPKDVELPTAPSEVSGSAALVRCREARGLWFPESLGRARAEADAERALSWDAVRLRERDEARDALGRRGTSEGGPGTDSDPRGTPPAGNGSEDAATTPSPVRSVRVRARRAAQKLARRLPRGRRD